MSFGTRKDRKEREAKELAQQRANYARMVGKVEVRNGLRITILKPGAAWGSELEPDARMPRLRRGKGGW